MTLIKFEHITISENNEPLLDLAKFGFILDPAYYNQGLAESPNMLARAGVVERLQQVDKELHPYRLKIWDAWRSRSVQRNIYNSFWNDLAKKNPNWNDERLRIEVGTFCTNPDNPSRIPPHATGGAVDLTIIDSQGKELPMGTPFDHLGPESATMYFEESGRDLLIRDNRRRLREAMCAEDFRYDDDEWWDFNWGSQIWAATKNKPFAVYGEAKNPTPQVSTK